MFNNNNNSSKKEVSSQVEFDVVMGSKTKISGNIDSEGSIRIDGVLNGDITATGDVIIGANAEINGNINSDNIDISGIVNGNIYANNTLKIYESGRLNGDFECSNFHISDGGFFSGSCTIRGSVSKADTKDSVYLDLDVDVKNKTLETSVENLEIDEDGKNNSKKSKKNSK